jgi:hypothetical protein
MFGRGHQGGTEPPIQTPVQAPQLLAIQPLNNNIAIPFPNTQSVAKQHGMRPGILAVAVAWESNHLLPNRGSTQPLHSRITPILTANIAAAALTNTTTATNDFTRAPKFGDTIAYAPDFVNQKEKMPHFKERGRVPQRSWLQHLLINIHCTDEHPLMLMHPKVEVVCCATASSLRIVEGVLQSPHTTSILTCLDGWGQT